MFTLILVVRRRCDLLRVYLQVHDWIIFLKYSNITSIPHDVIQTFCFEPSFKMRPISSYVGPVIDSGSSVPNFSLTSPSIFKFSSTFSARLNYKEKKYNVEGYYRKKCYHHKIQNHSSYHSPSGAYLHDEERVSKVALAQRWVEGEDGKHVGLIGLGQHEDARHHLIRYLKVIGLAVHPNKPGEELNKRGYHMTML